MVPDATFMVKFNTLSQKVWKFNLSADYLWQGCQIVDIDVPLDRSCCDRGRIGLTELNDRDVLLTKLSLFLDWLVRGLV